MSEFVAHTTGDVKEAIERTREAEAYNFEAVVRKFNGDKVRAEKYVKMREGRWSTRRDK